MEPEPLQIPIFELPLALVPGESVPLHIFEERYKRMTAHCLEQGEPFGIVLRTDDGARATGCASTVSEVIEQLDDGRLNIVVLGKWRFGVLDRSDGADFPVATVRRLEDEAGGAEVADPTAARAAFERLLDALGAEINQEQPLGTAFEIAARVEMPVKAKQELLEAASEPRRLKLLTASLDRLTARVERTRAVAERASGNGHGRYEGPTPG